MFRILFGEPKPRACKTCEALREQLAYERDRNKELIDTIASLVKPQTIIVDESTQELKPVPQRFSMWTRRRAELERMERERVRVQSSPHAAKPDKPKSDEVKDDPVSKLERELGVVEIDGEETVN